MLSAKLLTGAALVITRVVAGSGETQTTAGSLSQPCQTLAVNSPTRNGNNSTIPATLAAVSASGNYTLTELGVYANDPAEGEILYKIYRLAHPVNIVAGSSLALRFYLEETVSLDLGVTVECSPAGLLTEADLTPVKEKLFAVSTGSRSVSLEASQLQAFLESLPRLLTENITITVSGTTDEYIYIKNFYGSGSIKLQADAGGFTIQRQLQVDDCSIDIWLDGLTFDDSAGLDYDAKLLVWYSGSVHVSDCAFSGADTGTAIQVGYTSNARVKDCSIKNFERALDTTSNSMASLQNCADVAGNTFGIMSSWGALVWLAGNTPELLGGASNYKNGGLIAKVDGTLL